jgi:hypothetical protein
MRRSNASLVDCEICQNRYEHSTTAIRQTKRSYLSESQRRRRCYENYEAQYENGTGCSVGEITFDIFGNERMLTLETHAGSLGAGRTPRAEAAMRVRSPYGRIWTRRRSSPHPYFGRVLVTECIYPPSIPGDRKFCGNCPRATLAAACPTQRVATRTYPWGGKNKRRARPV